MNVLGYTNCVTIWHLFPVCKARISASQYRGHLEVKLFLNISSCGH